MQGLHEQAIMSQICFCLAPQVFHSQDGTSGKHIGQFHRTCRGTRGWYPHASEYDVNSLYKSFCHAIISAANKSIPRGCRSQYIPGWSAEPLAAYNNYKSAPTAEEAQVLGTCSSICLMFRGRQGGWRPSRTLTSRTLAVKSGAL